MKARILLALVLFAYPFPSQAQSAGITIAAVGDIMMGSDYPSPKLPRDGGRSLLAEAAPFFKGADIAMGNLEGPLCEDGEPVKVAVEGRSYVFRTPTAYAQNLKRAGISMVSLANNHALDFGRRGLLSTKSALRDAGIAFSSKSGEIAEFLVRGTRVGVMALSFGPAPRSIVYPEQALAEVAEAAKRYDILILTIHAGAEGRDALHIAPGMERYLGEPRGDLVRFARAAVERGADLIIGHGPHVPRALEIHRDRLIAYSLGNFATYGGINVSRENGYAPLVMLEIAGDGAFVKGKLHSFLQLPRTAPRPDARVRVLRLVQRLSRQDFPASSPLITDSGDILPR